MSKTSSVDSEILSKTECLDLFRALKNKDELSLSCKEIMQRLTANDKGVMENDALNTHGGSRTRGGISHAALQRRFTGKMSGVTPLVDCRTMELLLRGVATTRAYPAAPNRILVATYRSKRSTTKHAAARGAGNAANDKDPKKKDQRRPKRSSDRHEAPRRVQEAPHRPTLEEIDREWASMRQRTLVVPPPVLPARTRKEIENKRRMKRLGLIPEDDDENDSTGAFDPRNKGFVGQRKPREREVPRQPLHFHDGRTTRAERELQNAMRLGSNRIPARRPVAMKDKQFTNLKPAPDSVVEREFLVPDEPRKPRALDLAVIGRPNAGKSSIVNGLLNVTVSAVSPKYNTTRERVLGILTEGDAQLAFYDTPGLIKPNESHEYVQTLVTTAQETLQGVDVSMLVVDSVKRLEDSALQALEKVLTTSAQVCSPTMLVMNKYDLVGKHEKHNLDMKVKEVSQMIEEIYGKHYHADGASVAIDPLAYIGENSINVSALKGYGMDDLRKTLLSLAVDRPWSYHSSMHSDMSDLELVTEIIREQLYRRFNKELPYTFEQENVGWTKFKDKSLRIDQDIFVPAARVRKMVVGTDGNTIRSVGMAANREIQALLNKRVHLYLNVRVR
ncbi:hypothetical protein BBO99_00005357 [Phytophthora kernoviae]|uniref:KH type-2 domain-containing protein n=2 Tax=Phytophthora kernoviae TaxID=325452 RepID=A0A3R7MY11_9STRA|nr:hypothetical protein G195_006010 [Phytophthora kernoviae 00238/432]KAG2523580.1 hypothetical protein JM16_005184 [Phytophthora kernoviae]KAG2525560.1 hypothetical protein JM18_004810 [Phytophthora kernoviae]RLN46570.1 hypothetical protein BBI17_005408 [Phytophthora kernoviae]RLN79318.1 hypothetical protein BBO99_00005357 [Phytophthora kernoviae]